MYPFLLAWQVVSNDGHKRWMQFLHVWQNAGWSLQAILQVTDELRPLQYGSDLGWLTWQVYKQRSSTAALQNTVTRHKSRHTTAFQTSWHLYKDTSHSTMQCAYASKRWSETVVHDSTFFETGPQLGLCDTYSCHHLNDQMLGPAHG